MKVDDRKYKILVRTGFIVVAASVLALGEAPPRYHLWIWLISGIGALIGFSPLATRHPFRSDEDEPGLPEGSEELRLARVNSERIKPAGEADPPTKSDPSLLELYLETAYSQMRTNLIQTHMTLSQTHRSVGTLLIALENTNPRAERIREVHDLIGKLTGSGQRFSVELTSADSIIIHCDARGHFAPHRGPVFPQIPTADEEDEEQMPSGSFNSIRKATVH